MNPEQFLEHLRHFSLTCAGTCIGFALSYKIYTSSRPTHDEIRKIKIEYLHQHIKDIQEKLSHLKFTKGTMSMESGEMIPYSSCDQEFLFQELDPKINLLISSLKELE